MAMKKGMLSFCLFILVLMQMAGCGPTIKSDQEIIQTAYENLSEDTKKTIVDWENAKIEIEKSNDFAGYLVGGPNGVVSTKGRDTYMITFQTDEHEVSLGPVCVFLDQYSYDFIGVGLRD